MIILGLTGSIGMGKSTAATLFTEMGVAVHDADAVVHDLMQPNGAAFADIAAAFPAVVKNGTIDRALLGKIVFADQEKLKRLEEILHPKVRAATDAFLADCAKKGHDLVVLDIPLLFETGADQRVDAVLVVTAPPEIQKQRVLARPQMTAAKLKQILQRQMPDAEKRARADFIVEMIHGCEQAKKDLEHVIKQAREKIRPDIWQNKIKPNLK